MATDVKEVEVTFSMEKATKNTIRYAEDVPDGEYPVCGSIYLQKPIAARLGNPTTIKATIAVG